jgi:methylamine dehydrogenase heavy chain
MKRRIDVLRNSLAALALSCFLTLPSAARADLQPESPGTIEKLSPPFDAHWVWVADLVLERLALIDLDSGKFLGLINGGYGPMSPQFGVERGEMYLASTYFSRRVRGTRTDALEIYDIATLSPVDEIIVPSKRATDAVALGHTAITDDERFVAVFNWTPATSLSIVDVVQRRLAGEVTIPGCSLVYAAGKRRFFSLCADGSALVLTLNDDGSEASKKRTQPFFDPIKDPITEKAVRHLDQWIFASFDGMAYVVDVAADELRFEAPWSLLSDAERSDSWRIGGLQHLAVHEKSGRLYSMVHQGGPDTHKEAGSEVWVYDLKTRERRQRIELLNPGVTLFGFPIDISAEWIWPFSGLFEWALDNFAPAAVTHIEVTRDDEPLLVTGSQFSGSLGIYNALDGTFLKRVQPVGWTGDTIFAPWSQRR